MLDVTRCVLDHVEAARVAVADWDVHVAITVDGLGPVRLRASLLGRLIARTMQVAVSNTHLGGSLELIPWMDRGNEIRVRFPYQGAEAMTWDRGRQTWTARLASSWSTTTRIW